MTEVAKDGTFSPNIVQPEIHNNPDTDNNGVTRVQDFNAPTLPEGQTEAVQNDPDPSATLALKKDAPQSPAGDAKLDIDPAKAE